MTIEDRRDREKSQMKDMIIKAAAQIIVTEGYDKLSVRKLANQIEYSPAIIYHYFKNKDEIVNQIMRQGHQQLLTALSEGQSEKALPEDRLKILTRKYIATALKHPDQYLAIQMNKSPAILEFTSYLFEGASEKKPALIVLTQAVRDICQGQNKSESKIEMTAQIIAASTLGLITKLILEKDINENRKQQLIDTFTDSVVKIAVI